MRLGNRKCGANQSAGGLCVCVRRTIEQSIERAKPTDSSDEDHQQTSTLSDKERANRGIQRTDSKNYKATIHPVGRRSTPLPKSKSETQSIEIGVPRLAHDLI
jgi:hypothetical protein